MNYTQCPDCWSYTLRTIIDASLGNLKRCVKCHFTETEITYTTKEGNNASTRLEIFEGTTTEMFRKENDTRGFLEVIQESQTQRNER